MKVFNEKHDAIIPYWLRPNVDAKNGESVPHTKVVDRVQFYYRQIINEQEVFLKIELSKDFILDLSDQIQDIQGQIVMAQIDNLPF